MRDRSMGGIVAAVAAFAFVSALLAQQPGPAKPGPAQPDLSVVWTLRSSPSTRYLGYTFTAEEPSMTPWAVERFKANKPSFGPHGAPDSNDPVNPTTIDAAGCFPPGVPRIYLHPFPIEIIQIPGRVVMFFEFNHFVRQIYTDGRKHNTDLGPLWMGDSIGTWQGDTLVVDTIGFNDKTWIDRMGHPHSEELHVVERIRRPNQSTLQMGLTIEDPKAYTKPWETQLNFQLRPDWNVTEMICEDNATFNEFLKNQAKPGK